MKRHVYTLFCIAFCYILKGQENPGMNKPYLALTPTGPNKIDVYDTVIINMCRGTKQGDFLDIPVSIKSDDQINALDFALTYNESTLEFDTIINYTHYVQMLSHLGVGNVLRLTSNSFTNYEKDTVKILSIRFKLLKPKPSGSDLQFSLMLLNGDACSYKIIDLDCKVISVNSDPESSNTIEIYPNPAENIVIIKNNEPSIIDWIDHTGKITIPAMKINGGEKRTIDCSQFISGLYFIRIRTEDEIVIRKLYIK